MRVPTQLFVMRVAPCRSLFGRCGAFHVLRQAVCRSGIRRWAQGCWPSCFGQSWEIRCLKAKLAKRQWVIWPV